jgi:hypothetical protein
MDRKLEQLRQERDRLKEETELLEQIVRDKARVTSPVAEPSERLTRLPKLRQQRADEFREKKKWKEKATGQGGETGSAGGPRTPSPAAMVAAAPIPKYVNRLHRSPTRELPPIKEKDLTKLQPPSKAFLSRLQASLKRPSVEKVRIDINVLDQSMRSFRVDPDRAKQIGERLSKYHTRAQSVMSYLEKKKIKLWPEKKVDMDYLNEMYQRSIEHERETHSKLVAQFAGTKKTCDAHVPKLTEAQLAERFKHLAS